MKTAIPIKKARNRLIKKDLRIHRIVIVAPNDSVQLSQILLFAGKEAAEVHSFPGADEAMGFMTRCGPPHLIIAELQRSGSEGRGLCKMVRSREYSVLNHVPILVVLADGAGMDAHRIISRLGANDFLGTPFTANDLRAKTRGLLKAKPTASMPGYLPLDRDTAFAKSGTKAMHGTNGKPNQTWYREAFEAAGEAMLIFEEQTGMIVAANEAALSLYRSTLKELQAMRFGELAATEIGTCQESEKGGNLLHAWHRRKSGGGFAAEIVVRPFAAGSGRLNVAVVRDLGDRTGSEKGKEQTVVHLNGKQTKKQSLRGLLHICANCKKIRDAKGGWTALELYLSRHNGTRFSHGICPDCVRKLYPDHDK
jgi:DNA-binding response OmpR family regulator